MVYCQNCGKELDETKLSFCSNCGTPINVPQPNFESQPPIQSGFDIGNLPMKWFNFLIYFGLFASALINTVSGFQYTFINNYNFLNVVYGLSAFGVAALAMVTRFALASYKEKGPKLLLFLYCSTFAVNFTYNLLVSIIFGFNAIFTSPMFGSFIGTAIMVYCNSIYFTKRASLFTK